MTKTEPRRIRAAHSSGKWLMTDDPAFERNVRKLRQTHTIVRRTEATDSDFNGRVNWPDDGWKVWHPTGVDCSVEWDQDEWSLSNHGLLKLTDIQIHTAGGHLLKPCTLVWVELENRHNGGDLITGAFHADLDNTPLRRAANLEEMHSVRNWARRPGQNFLISFDSNRDQRSAKWRRYLQRELMKGTELRSGWSLPLPKDGTHRKAVLDLDVSNLHGENRLLPDDPSSDHRPIEWVGMLSGAR